MCVPCWMIVMGMMAQSSLVFILKAGSQNLRIACKYRMFIGLNNFSTCVTMLQSCVTSYRLTINTGRGGIGKVHLFW